MELRIILVLCLCLCLLTSPTLASVSIANALAKAAVGKGVALKTAAVKVLGAKALTGLALKAAAIKGALVLKGAAVVLGAKALGGLALKAAALKGAMLKKGVMLGKEVLAGLAGANVTAALRAKSDLLAAAVKPCDPSRIPTIVDIISGAWSCAQRKSQLVGQLVDEITGREQIIVEGPPVIFEYISHPRVYYETIPIIEKIEY